ncbi:hypothetical protein [Bradyrhizobium nitroreducens]|uniref:hypothetical protein n=1 Tax=Bradyrhizobium nitroreducens TaxID=709803 RepID=UPI000C1EA2B6|nr:hypothetical protein [Bradyrhizobium nitroreducens]
MIQLLIRTALLLFGNNWQSGLASELGVAERTLRRWVAGTAPVPLGVWCDVRTRLHDQSVEVARMHARLSGLLPDTGKITLEPIPNTKPEVDIHGIRFYLKRPDGTLIACKAQRGVFADVGVGLPHDMLPIFEQCSDSFLRAASVKFQLGEFDDRLGIVLEPSDVIILPNPNTRVAVLGRYGIVDHPRLSVRALKPDDGLWRVAISGDGNPLVALDVGGALKLADELIAIGESSKLAAHICTAAADAAERQARDA